MGRILMNDKKNSLETKNSLDKFDRLYNHLKAKTWEKGIPLLGSLELTPRCTLDCKMCYVRLEPSQMDQGELIVRQWIGLIDEACDAGMMFATLTGGECLLYPGFKEIYRHLQSRGVLVTVLTNGTLIDEDIVQWFVENPPQRIQISVYGSSPKGYEAVTGNGNAFHRVDKAIDLLKSAGLPLNLAITASRQLFPDFEATLRYCTAKDVGPCRVNSCPFHARRETQRNFDGYAPTLDEQVEIYKIQKKLHNETVQKNECEEVIANIKKDRTPQLPPRGIPCSAGRNSFSINWRGEMLPCNVFDFAKQAPLKTGFMRAWQELNSRCKEYLNPTECVGCAYLQACRFCSAGHYMTAGEGRANPDVCAEAKRMVAEGIRVI